MANAQGAGGTGGGSVAPPKKTTPVKSTKSITGYKAPTIKPAPQAKPAVTKPHTAIDLQAEKNAAIKAGKTAPAAGTTYTVKAGDTLSGIGAKYKMDWKALAKLNNIANPNVISVGQKLKITAAAPPAVSKPVPAASSKGGGSTSYAPSSSGKSGGTPKTVSAPKPAAGVQKPASGALTAADLRFIRQMEADDTLHDKNRLAHYVNLKSRQPNATFPNKDLERYYRQSKGGIAPKGAKPAAKPAAGKGPLTEKDLRFMRHMEQDSSLHDKARLAHYVQLKDRMDSPTFPNKELERYYRHVKGQTKTRLDVLWEQASGYKGQIDALMKQGPNYNVENDPVYQSMVEMAKKQAASASVSAMEDMNDRGILNSTVTSDRLGQIQQGAMDQVTAAIPELEAQAYGRHMDKIESLYNMMGTLYDQASEERGFVEDKRRWDLGYTMDREKFEEGKKQWKSEFDLEDWRAKQGQANFDREQDFRETQAKIENSLKERGLELDQLQYQLAEIESLQKEQGHYNDQATQQALGSALKYNDVEGAAQWLSDNAYKLYQNGADLSKVIDALDKRFGGFKSSVTGSSGDSYFSR
jgi:LysM repeat protein